jgi:adenylate cyclase
MSLTNVSILEQIRARVTKTLRDGIQLDMSTDESKKFLKRHANRKMNVIIMFIDINNSTEMSLSLLEDKFALMIQTFAQEISIAVTGYGGYVFKYEGDAVIVLFPGEYDQVKACENALNCTTSILEIIGKIINPAFKENGLPQITLRIGLDFGEALVVPYGKILEKAHIDIIGSSISIAAKIVSVAQPNQVLLGESIYDIIFSVEQNNERNFQYNKRFQKINLDLLKWNYKSNVSGKVYSVYNYLK